MAQAATRSGETPAALAGGGDAVGLPGSCQVPAAAWEAPSPEILIQDRHRTGFSTGSAKGDRDRKKRRGQEGSRPAGEMGGPSRGTPGPHWNQSHPALRGPRWRGHGLRILHRFHF